MSDRLIEDLKKDIAKGNVVFLIGSGVSIASAAETPSKRAASWIGLLEEGIDYIRDKKFRTEAGWYEEQKENLLSGKLNRLLLVGQEIEDKLGGSGNGQFKRWIKESVGSLQIGDDTLIRAILNLGCPVTTTNYDNLLEEVSGLEACTWSDQDRLLESLRNEDPAIIHWHGHVRDSSSIVLGWDSYAKIKSDLFAQENLKSLFLTKSIVFVGMKDGLSDPNFAPLREWMTKVLEQSTSQHYLIGLESEFGEMAIPTDGLKDRIFTIAYGKDARDYGKLAPFISALKEEQTKKPESEDEAEEENHVEGDLLPEKPMLIGREGKVQAFVNRFLEESEYPFCILGIAGVGKTNFALNVLHHSMIREHFGSRRFFMSCEGVQSIDLFWPNLAEAIGLHPGEMLRQRCLQSLQESPAVLVVDNFETVLDYTSREEYAGIVKDLKSCEGLKLLFTIRRNHRPHHIDWEDPERLSPLPAKDTKRLFLKKAGKHLEDDPSLDTILAKFDGHPLTTIIIANLARGEEDLEDLLEAWEEEEDILWPDEEEDKDHSLGISIELTLKSPRSSKKMRRILSILALFPDGLRKKSRKMLFKRVNFREWKKINDSGLTTQVRDATKLLQPIREYFLTKYEPHLEDHKKVLEHYGSHLGNMLSMFYYGWPNDFLAEINNISYLIKVSLRFGLFHILKPYFAAISDRAIRTGFDLSRLLKEIQEYAKSKGDRFLYGKSLTILSEELYLKDHLEEALKYANEAENIFRELKKASPLAGALDIKGQILEDLCRYDEAEDAVKQSLQIYIKEKDLDLQSNCYCNLASINTLRSEFSLAEKHLSLALQHDLAKSAQATFGNCKLHLGNIEAQKLNIEGAIEHFSDALKIAESHSLLLLEASILTDWGRVLVYESKTDHSFFQKAQEINLKIGRRINWGNSMMVMSWAQLVEGNLSEAKNSILQALKAFEPTSSMLNLASCKRILSEILFRIGDPKAESYSLEAIEFFSIDHPVDKEFTAWHWLALTNPESLIDNPEFNRFQNRLAEIGHQDLNWELDRVMMNTRHRKKAQ